MRRRLLVLALDGVPYDVLVRFRDSLGFLGELMDECGWGVMRAIDPPITVPAWACMFTGRDPGQLGFYGFRHLRRGRYESYIVSSRSLRFRYVWEEMGLRSIAIGVPPGYPARRYGVWISDFLTPGREGQWIYPEELAGEVERVSGGYVFDVEYRTERKREAWRELVEMTERRWRVARHLARKRGWDIFILHEIGTDRVHHLFQKYYDPQHPRYEPGNEFEDLVERYYLMVDRLIGDLVKEFREDGELGILVLSDHGNQAQRGVYAINMWLMDEGYLTLRSEPRRGENIEGADVDWGRTQVWAWGGYYSRIFINLKGREPSGIVGREEYEDLLRELRRKLSVMKAPWGHIQNTILRPGEIYREVRGDYPDLMLYMDGVRVRPVQTIGYESPWLSENDTGPDDSLHSFDGIYISTFMEHGKRDLHALQTADLIRKYFTEQS